jgi:hypothetical protein
MMKPTVWDSDEAVDEAVEHGLSTAGHTPTAHPARALVEAICAASNSKLWDEARLEWRLALVYIEYDGTCVCGQHPIHERCEIRNIRNGHTMEVGNICVHQFLGIETKAIFDGIRRVVRDHRSSFGFVAMAHFLRCGWMSDWECEFYRDTLRRQKRSLTAKQIEKRTQINEKMLRLVHSRGLNRD